MDWNNWKRIWKCKSSLWKSSICRNATVCSNFSKVPLHKKVNSSRKFLQIYSEICIFCAIQWTWRSQWKVIVCRRFELPHFIDNPPSDIAIPLFVFFPNLSLFARLFRQYRPSELPDKHENKLMWQSYFFIFRKLKNQCYISIYCTKKPYFQSPGISWKAQKDQVIIIFYQGFGSKKDRISHLRKVQNKNFSVISKYHLSSTFWLKKDRVSHLRNVQNKNFSVISKYHFSSTFWLKKDRISHLRKFENKNLSLITEHGIQC